MASLPSKRALQLPVPPEAKVVLDPEIVLAEVRRLMDGGTTEAELQGTLDAVLEAHRSRIKLTVVAVAHQRVVRVLRLLDWVDNLEQELTRPERVQEGIDTATLVAMLRYLSGEVNKTLTFLQETLDLPDTLDPDPFPGAPNELHLHKHEHYMLAEKGSREKVRQLFTKLEQIARAEE